jgi:hypothetical protein
VRSTFQFTASISTLDGVVAGLGRQEAHGSVVLPWGSLLKYRNFNFTAALDAPGFPAFLVASNHVDSLASRTGELDTGRRRWWPRIFLAS